MSSRRTGRTMVRPVLAVAGVLLLTVVLALGLGGTYTGVRRGPISLPNPTATSPNVTSSGHFDIIENGLAPESLIIDSIAPTGASRLLFFQGRTAQPDPHGGGLIVDGGGGLLRVDEDLRATRISVDLGGREVASVASAPNGGLWITSGDGQVMRVDAGGALIAGPVTGPFMYSSVTSDENGLAWLVRSPDRTGFRPVFRSTPLLARLTPDGEVAETVGSGLIPKDFLLTHLASAGRIAASDSLLFYAPFIRDEVISLSQTGDTLWVATRGLPQSVPEPRFEVIDNEPMVDYAPVNLAIAVGPDGNLYVLSIPGFTTSQSRLDVLDAASGRLVRSTTIDDPLPTLSVDETGRVYSIDAFALLAGVPPRERQPWPDFDLETLRGERFSSARLQGKVTLINFWASWCAPCRVEMPALDSLRAGITDPDFQFITMNEDVQPERGRAFVEEYGFEFPVLLGRGNLRDRYHYIGLPFTVLIDRSGRVTARWTGFAGEDQIGAIRALIEAELVRGTMADLSNHGAH